MKRFIAFILLLVFITSQYARHASYLECWLINYINDGDSKCDCEKILADTGRDSSSVPINHRHIHYEETYFIFQVADDCSKKYQPGSLRRPHSCEMLCEGILVNCYHPPKTTS